MQPLQQLHCRGVRPRSFADDSGAERLAPSNRIKSTAIATQEPRALRTIARQFVTPLKPEREFYQRAAGKLL